MRPALVETLSGPEHPALKRLHAYWLAKRGQGEAPPRSAVDPGDIRELLPNVLLFDVVGTPPRFRTRLFGTGLVEAYGEEATGRFADDVDLGDVGPQIIATLEKAVEECRPQSHRAEWTKHSGRYLQYEAIVLPLSGSGGTVDMLLCGVMMEKAYG